MKLSDLVNDFIGKERVLCQLLDPEQVGALAVAATRFYCGWGRINLTAVESDGIVPPVQVASISLESEVSGSDWAVIRPLFLLYCEREQALVLESSRVMGADVFGRSSSEVQGDITAYEADLPRKAFYQPIITI